MFSSLLPSWMIRCGRPVILPPFLVVVAWLGLKLEPLKKTEINEIFNLNYSNSQIWKSLPKIFGSLALVWEMGWGDLECCLEGEEGGEGKRGEVGGGLWIVLVERREWKVWNDNIFSLANYFPIRILIKLFQLGWGELCQGEIIKNLFYL